MNIDIPTLLDVAIALVFIYFVFSIFVSGIVEFINTLIDKRANLFRLAIDKLLGPLAESFFQHQLIQIKESRLWKFRQLSIDYLSADSFSTVLIDLLVKGNESIPTESNPAEETFEKLKQVLLDPTPDLKTIKDLIRPILAKSKDFQTFKAELEKWYNGYMEQVSGWFKRHAQGVVWIVAGSVALFLNVDTIHLTDRLFNDDGLRDRLVAEAVKTAQDGGKSFMKDELFKEYLDKHGYDTTKLVKPIQAKDTSTQGADTTLVEPISEKSTSLSATSKNSLTSADNMAVQYAYVQFVKSRVADLQLPIGWVLETGKSLWQPGQTLILAILGWILTAAALSFGAPFWFDLLLKLVNIRNTARRPPGNPDPA